MEIIIKNAKMEEAKELDGMLSALIQDERKYDKNINSKYIVKNYYKKFVGKENACIAVAKDENSNILGYCFGFIENYGDIYNEKIAKLDALYVKIKYRKNGVAKRLIKYFNSWAKEKGAKKIELSVCEENKNAIKLYEKFEFKPVKKIMAKKLK